MGRRAVGGGRRRSGRSVFSWGIGFVVSVSSVASVVVPTGVLSVV